MIHYHVQSGLAGYGPDADETTPTFESLSDALEYARDELGEFSDMAHQSAHAHADQGDFESAWQEIIRCETLDTLRANLDPKRRSAPLYADDATAYAALQESQAAEFPHDVSYNSRLYLWSCSDEECTREEEPAMWAPMDKPDLDDYSGFAR